MAESLPTLGDKQASTVSNKKAPKFNQVTIPLTQQVVSFCEYCFSVFQANEKCDFCYQVYLNSADDGEVDGKLWMSCDNEDCLKWNHPDCEIEYGKDPEYAAAAQESKRQQQEEDELMAGLSLAQPEAKNAAGGDQEMVASQEESKSGQ